MLHHKRSPLACFLGWLKEQHNTSTLERRMIETFSQSGHNSHMAIVSATMCNALPLRTIRESVALLHRHSIHIATEKHSGTWL